VKFTPKRFAPKWTSNKMGNAKKGHNKTGRDKVVVQKDVLLQIWGSSKGGKPLPHQNGPPKMKLLNC